jgi:hypothetical protein
MLTQLKCRIVRIECSIGCCGEKIIAGTIGIASGDVDECARRRRNQCLHVDCDSTTSAGTESTEIGTATGDRQCGVADQLERGGVDENRAAARATDVDRAGAIRIGIATRRALRASGAVGNDLTGDSDCARGVESDSAAATAGGAATGAARTRQTRHHPIVVRHAAGGTTLRLAGTAVTGAATDAKGGVGIQQLRHTGTFIGEKAGATRVQCAVDEKTACRPFKRRLAGAQRCVGVESHVATDGQIDDTKRRGRVDRQRSDDLNRFWKRQQRECAGDNVARATKRRRRLSAGPTKNRITIASCCRRVLLLSLNKSNKCRRRDSSEQKNNNHFSISINFENNVCII